jgi:hypothetical protein
MRLTSLAWLLLLPACTTASPEVPAVYFKMFYGSSYDMQPFNDAWNAARTTNELAYTFPLITVDMPPATELRLIAGRSSNDVGYPSTIADDVIIADEHVLATTTLDGDGRGEFVPLAVATGSWQCGTNSIPADLLCGNTVIAVRAFEKGTREIPAYRFVASTWMVAVTGCD